MANLRNVSGGYRKAPQKTSEQKVSNSAFFLAGKNNLLSGPRWYFNYNCWNLCWSTSFSAFPPFCSTDSKWKCSLGFPQFSELPGLPIWMAQQAPATQHTRAGFPCPAPAPHAAFPWSAAHCNPESLTWASLPAQQIWQVCAFNWVGLGLAKEIKHSSRMCSHSDFSVIAYVDIYTHTKRLLVSLSKYTIKASVCSQWMRKCLYLHSDRVF